MPNLFVVRSNYGQFTPQFLKGKYVAIGWMGNQDLSAMVNREELYPIYKQVYPQDTSNIVIGVQVGQIGRFLLDIQVTDYVITQSVNSDHIHYGIVTSGYYHEPNSTDSCNFAHRKSVKWLGEISRSAFSVPFQNTIRSSLTVFRVADTLSFFQAIGKPELSSDTSHFLSADYHISILQRVYALESKEFEILITHLLSAIGFEGAQHTGRTGDGGVDATGELNLDGMAKIKLFVQAKCKQPLSVISAKDVKTLRQSIPRDGQGVFITTAKFNQACEEVASDPSFPRIGLINGNQFVELLGKYWYAIPEDFRIKLGLRIGLVPA
jgi:predicted Mrr-cat superfamily restriction endonuclease